MWHLRQQYHNIFNWCQLCCSAGGFVKHSFVGSIRIHREYLHPATDEGSPEHYPLSAQTDIDLLCVLNLEN